MDDRFPPMAIVLSPMWFCLPGGSTPTAWTRGDSGPLFGNMDATVAELVAVASSGSSGRDGCVAQISVVSSWDTSGPCLASTTCFNCGLLLVFDVLAGVVAPFAFRRPDIYGELALGEQFLLVDDIASLKPVHEELAPVCW